MYWIGLVTGLCMAYWAYEIGHVRGEYQGRQYGKAVAYRLCTSPAQFYSPFCTPGALGLPDNVRELPFEAPPKLP